jgi:hypothetical protein
MPSYLVPQKFIVAGVAGFFIHDGVDNWTEDIVSVPKRAIVNYLTLPNQVLYDTDGEEQSKIAPSTMTFSAIYEGAGVAAMVTEMKSWQIAVGYKGTLTAVQISDVGTTYSCTARLETFEITTPYRFISTDLTAPSAWRVALTFRPTTNWEAD